MLPKEAKVVARILVLDTETTGFSPEWDRIVEVAAAEIAPRTGILGRECYHLINPRRAIPAPAVEVHGITNEKVKDKPPFEAIADQLAEFLKDATIAMHNSAFDIRMLDAELSRAGRPTLSELKTTVIDTVAVAQSVYPLLPKHNLDALCGHLNIDLEGRALHGAAIDIRLMSLAFPKMAVDYDAWMAIVEDACAAELDDFERAIFSFCDELVATASRASAEEVDRSLSRVGTALRAVNRQYEVLMECCALLVGPDSWYCKHFAARWETYERLSWKSAADALIPGVDLRPYQKASVSETVSPKKVPEIESQLSDICAPLSSGIVTSSLHYLTRALTILSTVERTLASEKDGLREELLAYKKQGYTPTACSVKSSERTSPDYKQACHDHAPDADFTAYASTSNGLKVRHRLAEPCHILWRA